MIAIERVAVKAGMDGIYINRYSDFGDFIISSDKSVRTAVDGNAITRELTNERCPEIWSEFSDFIDKDRFNKCKTRINVVCIIIALIISILSLEFGIICGTIYFVVFASEKVYTLITLFYLAKFGEAKQLSKYWGAANKLLNALAGSQRTNATVDEVQKCPEYEKLKKASMIWPDDKGDAIIREAVFFSLIALVIMLPSGMAKFVGIGLTVLLIVIDSKLRFTRVLQRIYISKPDMELQAAQQGLQGWIYLKEAESKGQNAKEMNVVINSTYLM